MNNIVPTDLNSEMRCGLLTNSSGGIVIIHSQKINSEIQWAEYRRDTKQLVLIHENGEQQDMGVTIDKNMNNNLLAGTEIILTRIENKEVIDTQKVSLVITDIQAVY